MELKIKYQRGCAVINMNVLLPTSKKNLDLLQKKFLQLDDVDHKEEMLHHLEERIWQTEINCKDLAQKYVDKRTEIAEGRAKAGSANRIRDEFDRSMRELKKLRMNHEYISRW